MGNYLANAQVAIGIRRIRPIHVHLAVEIVPVDVRDIAIKVARAASLPNFFHFHRRSFTKSSALASSLLEVFLKHSETLGDLH